jgi:hypothetical protein
MGHAHTYPKAKRMVIGKYLGLSDVQAGHNGLILAKPLQVNTRRLPILALQCILAVVLLQFELFQL